MMRPLRGALTKERRPDITRAPAMTQQYELELLDDAEEAPHRGYRAAFLRRGGLPAIIDAEASTAPGKRIRPSKARPAFLPRDCVAEDAFRLTLLQCKWHISANVPAVVEARDVEGMHQLRSELRHEMALAGRDSGAYVYDMTTDTPVFSLRATTKRPPASVEKLFTSIAALHELGDGRSIPLLVEMIEAGRSERRVAATAEIQIPVPHAVRGEPAAAEHFCTEPCVRAQVL